MSSTTSEPTGRYRIESRVDEKGEPWTPVEGGNMRTLEAAVAVMEVHARYLHQLDLRVVDTITDEVVA